MHYSDCYQLIKKIPDKRIAARIRQQLKDLEKNINSPSFITYLKARPESEQSIYELQKQYDLEILQKVQDGIEAIDFLQCNHPTVREIQAILTDIKNSAHSQVKIIKGTTSSPHFKPIIKKYATHFIPFTQANDPFKGGDFHGYCWGHTHRYGQLASQNALDNLSIASNKKLLNINKTNWTFFDILFRRVGWYFSVNLEIKLRMAIWDALKQLDETTILNFNFLISGLGFHSTSLRMVGEAVEYYENNFGLVRFRNRENAVNFLANHLLLSALNENRVKLITVYKLPYKNAINHDVLSNLPQSVVEEEKLDHPAERIGHSNQTITALSQYAKVLQGSRDIKARVKAHEIKGLVQELYALPDDLIKGRIANILENKNHSLMINRGTGCYFFKSKFKSHSSTETLLRAIV